jgi:hypothetical protein
MDLCTGVQRQHQRKGNYRNDRCACCRSHKHGARKCPKFVLRALVQGKQLNHVPFHVFVYINDEEPGKTMVTGRYQSGLSRWKRTWAKKDAINKHFESVHYSFSFILTNLCFLRVPSSC